MGDYVPLPRRLSTFHIDDDAGDGNARPADDTRRQRGQPDTTSEAPKSSRRQRDRSDPVVERPPSPSARYSSTKDDREFEHMEERELEKFKRREGSGSDVEEIRSLRRQLRERDEQYYAQRALIEHLEDEVSELRQRLSMQGSQPTDGRPTYIKVHRKHLAAATLEKFRLPWEYDPNDPDFIIIKQYIDERFQNELFEHTRELKEREKALREREERVLILEERERQRRDTRPVIISQGRRERYYERERPLVEERRPSSSANARRRDSDVGPARRSRTNFQAAPATPLSPDPTIDGWRFTGAAETPRDDVERPRPRGGPR